MRYRTLGKTNLNISVIGFGGIPIQRTTVEKTKEVIIKSEELGINFIDTARGYSVSEEYIGQCLEGRRDKWIIATKSMARDKESMINDINVRLNNLKTDHIDLYQIHNVKTIEDLGFVLSENGAYKALEEAKEEGKIGHIGLTSHSLELLEHAIELNKFETIMYPYNIVENQADKLFKRCAELNIGVIAMKPMAGGAITKGRLALKYILNNSNINVAIPGMADLEEVEENALVGSEDVKMTEDDVRECKEIKDSLGSVFCRRCGYCGPCPQGIDIPTMFIFSGYKERYGLGSWAEERYATMKKRAKDCVKCGICERRCPYDLPIREMLEKVNKIFGE